MKATPSRNSLFCIALSIATLLSTATLVQAGLPTWRNLPQTEVFWKLVNEGAFRVLPENMKVEFTERQFKNCAEAQSFLRQMIELNRQTIAQQRRSGSTEIGMPFLYNAKVSGLRPRVMPPPRDKIEIYQDSSGMWIANAPITFDIDSDKSILTLPNWTWPNMTQQEQNALHQNLRAIINHEMGHVTIAKQIAENSKQRFSGRGAEKNEAIKSLVNNVKAFLDKDLLLRIDREQERYDQITNHGALQSRGSLWNLPGGENLIFSCPNADSSQQRQCPWWGCPEFNPPQRNNGCPWWGCP